MRALTELKNVYLKEQVPFCANLLIETLLLSFLSVSCQKIAVNLTALGEDTLVFPNGKLMTKHQTLENGYEYEVGLRIVFRKLQFHWMSHTGIRWFWRYLECYRGPPGCNIELLWARHATEHWKLWRRWIFPTKFYHNYIPFYKIFHTIWHISIFRMSRTDAEWRGWE